MSGDEGDTHNNIKEKESKEGYEKVWREEVGREMVKLYANISKNI